MPLCIILSCASLTISKETSSVVLGVKCNKEYQSGPVCPYISTLGVRELCWNNFGNNDGAKE